MKRLFEGPITFVKEDHSYYVESDGVTSEKPSLSSVLKRKGLAQEYGSDIPSYVLEKAARRGTEVHAAVHDFLTTGQASIVDPGNESYYNHAIKLIQKYELETVYSETPMYNPIFEYCTTPDFVGYLTQKRAKIPAIIDWKTTSRPSLYHGFQVSGQALCFRNPDAFELYIGDLKTGELIKVKHPERYLQVTREAFQNHLDVTELMEEQ